MSPDPVFQQVVASISHSLQLGERSAQLSLDTRLLGHIPELDSMAVLTVITGLEEHFAITFDEDDITAESFETVGNLVDLVRCRVD